MDVHKQKVKSLLVVMILVFIILTEVEIKLTLGSCNFLEITPMGGKIKEISFFFFHESEWAILNPQI